MCGLNQLITYVEFCFFSDRKCDFGHADILTFHLVYIQKIQHRFTKLTKVYHNFSVGLVLS